MARGESIQYRKKARTADVINKGFLLARNQILLVEIKYCHAEDQFGHPNFSTLWLRTRQKADDPGSTEQESDSFPHWGEETFYCLPYAQQVTFEGADICPRNPGFGSSSCSITSCRLNSPQRKTPRVLWTAAVAPSPGARESSPLSYKHGKL